MIKKVLKDPFIHFLLLGFLVFIIVDDEYVFSSEEEPEKPKIIITPSVENLIVLKFKSNQGREPNKTELKLLTEQYVREEVLVREAIKLGLDKNDHVIRARLVELVDSIGLANNKIEEPHDERLKQFAHDRAMRYSTGGKFSLEQVYLGKAPSNELVSETQQKIKNGASPVSLGVRSKFTFRFNHASKEAIVSMFGGEFFLALMEAELGQWTGPTRSPVGVHLVRVTERVEPMIPPVEDIKHILVSDWQNQQKRQLLDTLYENYRRHYDVVNHKDSSE